MSWCPWSCWQRCHQYHTVWMGGSSPAPHSELVKRAQHSTAQPSVVAEQQCCSTAHCSAAQHTTPQHEQCTSCLPCPAACKRILSKQTHRIAAYLFIPLCDIHETLIVVVLVGALGGVNRQQLVVGSQPVPLSIAVSKDTRLQQLVI